MNNTNRATLNALLTALPAHSIIPTPAAKPTWLAFLKTLNPRDREDVATSLKDRANVHVSLAGLVSRDITGRHTLTRSI